MPLRFLLTAVLFAILSAAAARIFAGDVTPAASTASWDRYDQQLAEVQWRLQQLETGNAAAADCVEPAAYAGFSFFFAKPHLKESFEATSTNLAAGTLQLIPLETDYELTPRLWLGATNRHGLGVRATYWQYDRAGDPQTFVSDGVNLPGATVTTVIYPAAIIAPAPGDVLSTNNSLVMHTLDLEGTVDVSLGGVDGRVGGGVRYARIEQVMAARATRGVATIGALDWSREMEGLGPIISADATRELWNNISAVGRFRGALLFGEKSIRRTVAGDVTPAVSAAPPTVQLNDADEVTAGFELGLGVQWTRCLAGGHEVFVQGMYEGQLWTEAGAPTLTFLGFEGFSLSTGLIW